VSAVFANDERLEDIYKSYGFRLKWRRNRGEMGGTRNRLHIYSTQQEKNKDDINF
jgi:hypothetical protein